MEKIIIFGGFGFIGKNLYEVLSQKFEVIIVDKCEDSKFLVKYPNIKRYQYDFQNQETLNEIIHKENPKYIINLISIVTADRDLSLFKGLIETNLDILMKIYEATKNSESLKLMIQFGSGEEYGNIESPYRETDKENPNSPYSIVKLMVTNTATMLNKNYNYPITVVRPANLFGKYQAENKFIPYIINKLKNNEEVITTPCEQKRDFIYSEKFAQIIEIIIENHS
ncbi:MAG: NAD-dependent epimerase/dehydratase family protein, partial [Cetobacterium sp.]